MAKILEQDRNIYRERSKTYNLTTDALLKNEMKILTDIKKRPADAPTGKLNLTGMMLNLSSNFMAINGISQAVLKVKNEEALNEGRKALYKAVIYLEEVVSNYIDVPFSDYEEKLVLIENYDPNQRYNLIRKMGLAIDLLKFAYGDNSKWRWTFVDLEGRFTVVAKNIIDLRNVIVNKNPDSEYYESTVYHLRLVIKLLAQSADRYREKYELSTGQTSDFKTAIRFLAALRRIHIILGESEDAEEIKKKLTIWSNKFEIDLKKQEEEKKKMR